MPEYSSNQPASPKTAIIGLGGAGHNILGIISQKTCPEYSLYAAHLDMRLLNASNAAHKILLGEKSSHGLGSGGDPAVGALAATISESQLKDTLLGKELVIIIAGLGGGTGSGAAPVIAGSAKKQQAFVVCLVVTPFSFEGARRKQQADNALAELKKNADMVLCFDNNHIRNLLSEDSNAVQAFDLSNTILANAAQTIHSIAYHPGFFHIGLDDLQTVASKGHCLFGMGLASGEQRHINAAKQLLDCPLFSKDIESIDDGNILIQFSGPDSLAIKEIEEAVKLISRSLPEQAQIHLGIAIRPELKDSIEIMLFAGKTVMEKEVPVTIIHETKPVPPPSRENTEDITPTPGQKQEHHAEETVPSAATAAIPEKQIQDHSPAKEQPEERPLIIETDIDPIDYSNEIQEDNTGKPLAEQPADDLQQITHETRHTGEFDFGILDTPHTPPAPELKELEKPQTEKEENAPQHQKQEPPQPSVEQPKEEPAPIKEFFSADDPFIVDGENLDLPPSMRKKRDTLL